MKLVSYEDQYAGQVIDIATEMHRDSMFRDYSFDQGKLLAQIKLVSGYPDTAYFQLAVRNGEVFGGFYGTISRMFFSEQLMARDVGWWVKKERRGGGAAMLLLRGFEAWAKEKGAIKVMIGQSSGIDIDRTTKLYQHCGYRLVGMNTVKDI